MKKIGILGSSGSIGKNTCDIVRQHPDKLKIVYLSVHSQVDILHEQIAEFNPEYVAVTDLKAYEQLKSQNLKCHLIYGDQACEEISKVKVDLCINALVGSAGVIPTLNAIENSVDIALANKETLVTAGIVVMEMARLKRVKIFPIDSEHSAIWQCLQGENTDTIESIILTASGGPFRGKKRQDLEQVTCEQALAHPNWKMGAKISIDSATLMNKGFEVIETFWLYPVSREQIKVLVHPQSIVHSMVLFKDGSYKTQCGSPDMRVPIQYAISYPERWPLNVARINFEQSKEWTFEAVDMETFSCLRLAFDALSESGTMPAVLNAANEITNRAFLENKIKFLEIADINEQVINAHQVVSNPTIESILSADTWARKKAISLVNKG